MGFTRLHRYLLSILSGLLMVVSFPYTGSLFPLVFIAWVPLLLVEHGIYERKYKSSKVFLHAYLTFFIYNLGTTYWIYYSEGGEVGAIMAYVLNSAIMAFVFLLFHRTKKNLGKKVGYLGLIICWMGLEYIHFHWELSWPWITIGNTFSIVPEIVQWYAFTGVLGGSLWILIANIIAFKFFDNVLFKKEKLKQQRNFIIGFIFIIVAPTALSLGLYSSYEETDNPIEVVVTQPNIDPYTEKFSTSVIAQLDKVLESADSVITPHTDIVLAPETAIPKPFNEAEYKTNKAYNYLLNHLLNWGNTSLYIGASTYRVFTQDRGVASRPIPKSNLYYENYNASFLMSTNHPPDFVHKSKLVLGVEKIPFTKWFPFLEELSIENGGTSGTLGVEKEPQVLTTKGFTFAPIVCYESLYSEWVAQQCEKGAEILFVITNDGWWGNSAGYKQHASFSRLRAIETRRDVVCSANTGTSFVINQRGDVLKATEYWVQTAFNTKANLNKEKTFYVTYGDYIGYFFFCAFLVLLLFLVIESVRRLFKTAK